MSTPFLKELNLYLLPGLGADARIFRHFAEAMPCKVHALEWVDSGKARNLNEYVQLLHEHYRLEAPYALGGVSLGGMAAQEWARLAQPHALVLISTICERSEMPLSITMAHRCGATKWLRKPLLDLLAMAGDRFTSKSREGRELFYQMLKDTHPTFAYKAAQWAASWEPCGTHVPVVRVHGTRDRVFPFRKTQGAIPMKGGNHFMIFDRGAEIAAVIAEALIQLPLKSAE